MCYTKQVWRRTEVAVTGLTRNQFTGFAPVRGFESLRLRLFIMWETPVFIGVSRFFISQNRSFFPRTLENYFSMMLELSSIVLFVVLFGWYSPKTII